MARRHEKVLIIGDNSYFAKNFIEKFAGKYDIIGFGNGAVAYNNKNFKHYCFDLLKKFPNNLPKADILIHIASITDPIFCNDNKEICFNANVIKTLEICQWAKDNKVKKYIYFSSGSVYKGQDKELTENDYCDPKNFYAWTKYFSEMAVLKYKRYFDVAIFRLFSPYGPKTHPDRVINRIIKKIENNQPIELNNNSRPKISPLYIDDLMQALDLTIKNKVKGEILNIGGNDPVNIKEISLIIGGILEKSPRFIETGKDVASLYCSNKKAKRIIGFSPMTNFRDGIKRTVDYYKNNSN